MTIDTVIFYTNDIKAITSFYKNTLPFKYDYGNDIYSSFMFENNVSLGIKQKEKDREVPGSQTVILKTKDILTLYKEINGKEIQIYKELTKEDWGTTFSILDLDGNKIEFVGE
jgi:catechol 2,3-dioxygenase-like lactoylglutathione lyase family enzyme